MQLEEMLTISLHQIKFNSFENSYSHSNHRDEGTFLMQADHCAQTHQCVEHSSHYTINIVISPAYDTFILKFFKVKVVV